MERLLPRPLDDLEELIIDEDIDKPVLFSDLIKQGIAGVYYKKFLPPFLKKTFYRIKEQYDLGHYILFIAGNRKARFDPLYLAVFDLEFSEVEEWYLSVKAKRPERGDLSPVLVGKLPRLEAYVVLAPKMFRDMKRQLEEENDFLKEEKEDE